MRIQTGKGIVSPGVLLAVWSVSAVWVAALLRCDSFTLRLGKFYYVL